MSDTICAISTPNGVGGIAVLRLSGERAVSIADSVFSGSKSLLQVRPNTIHFGKIINGEIIDEVLVSVFRAPHSFTGEDVVEISCHGSVYIQQTLLQLLISKGCRLANPGEFTQRAFLNGKMDLTQAEAVADLIAAESRAAHRAALSHLRGGISGELATLRDRLLQFTSLIELELDFADHEELEFADRAELQSLAQNIEKHLTELIDTFRTGNAVKNGVPVAIVGATNAGKSTLLNALVGEKRAIVSDIHGTTRDTIEDYVIIGGIKFRFIDTAGIRQTDNQIEEMGIQRSIQAAQKADIILYVKDAAQPDSDNILSGIDGIENKTIITLYNKADLLDDSEIKDRNKLFISAKKGELGMLKSVLVGTVSREPIPVDKVLITNARHYQALLKAKQAIIKVQAGLKQNLSGELLSLDLQDCLNALGEITGQITSQEVLNNVFAHFCIGK